MGKCLNVEASRPPVRVLFGAIGWPSGVLEVASWAKHEGLAEPLVVPIPTRGVDEAEASDAAGELGEAFVERLMTFRPHVVGFRVEGGQFDRVKRLVRATRALVDAEIVLGGPTATSHPREVLRDSGADYVFSGEAELPFADFLRLARGRNCKDDQPKVPGLAYRYGDRVYLNTLPEDGYGRTVLDLEDDLRGARLKTIRHLVRPLVDNRTLEANRLDWSLVDRSLEATDSLYFTGGRGCPGECTFCAKLHGQTVRTKSAEQLLEEIVQVDARVNAGDICVSRWPLFAHTIDPSRQELQVAWAAVYDEDFFLHRRRAIDFFRIWADHPLSRRYRISLQTNPCSMLDGRGVVDAELLEWIDRVKPMVQLGAESFNHEVLTRWHKRHTVDQLNTVLDALDRTRQDYTVFQLLTDFETTAEELVESLRLLILAAYRHRGMRVASSPFTIPLYESQTRRDLEYGCCRRPEGGSDKAWVEHFTDYERPRPDLMIPLVAELAELADAELYWSMHPEQRDGALLGTMKTVRDRLRAGPDQDREGSRRDRLVEQAEQAYDEIREAQFQGILRP